MGSDTLPDEIICKIFSFSNPIDVVRARLVSKRIRNITYDHELWKTLYSNARFPRPPGPFPSQSTHFLERSLVQSARLAESWTTRPMEEVSSSVTRLALLQRASPKLVCGRWIISCEQASKLVSHDPTRTPFRQVIWEAQDGRSINFWESCSVSSIEGESVYVVVFSKPGPHLLWLSQLLEFRVNGDSLDFCSSLDIPADGFQRSTGLLSDKGPFIYLMGLRLIFDTRTRVFYTFPEFSTQLDGIVPSPMRGPHNVLLTNTHLIGLHYSVVGGTPASVLLQAFRIPTRPRLSPNGAGILQLTHECIGVHEVMSLMSLIRDSVVDPLTGTTSLRFVSRSHEYKQIRLRCVDLTLPKPRDDSVLPILFNIHDIVTVPGPFSPADDRFSVHLQVDASSDGYVRGYYRFRELVDDGTTEEYRYFTTKFTIDATQERCQAVVGEPAMQDKRSHVTKPALPAWFDGIRGRICYGTGPMDGVHGYDLVYVADIR